MLAMCLMQFKWTRRFWFRYSKSSRLLLVPCGLPFKPWLNRTILRILCFVTAKKSLSQCFCEKSSSLQFHLQLHSMQILRRIVRLVWLTRLLGSCFFYAVKMIKKTCSTLNNFSIKRKFAPRTYDNHEPRNSITFLVSNRQQRRLNRHN